MRPRGTEEADGFTMGEFRALWAEDRARAVELLDCWAGRRARKACVEAGAPGSIAEDLKQDFILFVCDDPARALGAADADAPFGPWLFGALRNTARENARTEGRREVREEHSARQRGDRGDASVPARVEAEDERTWFRDHFEALTLRQREAAALYADGLSSAESAARLKITPAAFRDRLRRAVTRLKRVLAHERVASVHVPLPPVAPDTWRKWPLVWRVVYGLWQDGRSRAQIAETVRKSKEAVHSLLKRLRVVLRP